MRKLVIVTYVLRGLGFVLVLLSLLSCVRLTALNERAAVLSRELETARAENAALSVAYEQSVSLPELARRAAALGMQPCTPSQIVTLPMPEE